MKQETAIFFWGAQYQFEHAKGVIDSVVGYMGGDKEHPTYQEVKAHTTGHAEVTKVVFDADQTSYVDLCKLFFETRHPMSIYVSCSLRFMIRHKPTDKVRTLVRSTEVKSFI